MTGTTATLDLTYPTGTDEVNQGAAAIETLAGGIDAEIPLLAGDVLQAGVIGVADGTVANPAVSVVGAVSYTGLTAGNAWVALSSGALVRNVIPTGSLSSTPGSLPATGKYAVVGIDLVGTPGWGSAATVGLSSKGADETSQALAIANPPAVASGHLRILDVVILNTAGTYSLSTTVDRRTFASESPRFGPGPTAVTRTVGTAYQPNATRTTFVTVTLALGSGAVAEVTIGPTSAATGYVAATWSGSGIDLPGSFIVPVAWYYEVTQLDGTVTILNTLEQGL